MRKISAYLLLTLASQIMVIFAFAQAGRDEVLLAGRDEVLLKRVDSMAASEMKEGKIPGLSLAIVDSGRTFIRSYGYSDVAARTPVTANTLFQLGSCSKAFTALAVMQLAKEGLIDLHANVSTYIPWFTVKYKDTLAGITILQLLHHTSGIPWQTISVLPEGGDSKALERTVRAIAGSDLRYPPGKKYEYATINYDILALVIQQVTGQPFETYLQQDIFNRLQLNSTTIGAPIDSSRMATGYKIGFFRPRVYSAPIFRGNNAAGYVISDATDMARWLQLQIGVLSSDLYPEMELTQHRDETVALHDNMLSYAMGWEVSLSGNGEIGHGGLNPNYTAHIAFRKDRQAGVLVLANSNSGYTDMLATRVMKLLTNERIRKEPEPGDGNDRVYSIVTIVLGIYILATLAFLFVIGYQVLTRKRTYEPFTRNTFYKMGRSVLAGLPFLLGLYLLPAALAGFTWKSVLVWAPVSFPALALATLIAMGISYLVYFSDLFFPEKNNLRRTAPPVFLISFLSGIANVMVIILVTSAINSGMRLRYLVFYYVLTLGFYILGGRFVQINIIRFTRELVYGLRIELIDKIFATSYQKFEKIDRGRIYMALIDDVETIGGAVGQLVVAVTNLFTTIGAFIYLSSLAFWATVVTVLVIAGICVLYYFVGKSTVPYFKAAKETMNSFIRLIHGMVDGYKELNLKWNKKKEYKADIEAAAAGYKDKLSVANIRYVNASLAGELMLVLLLGIVVFAVPRLFTDIPRYTLMSFVFVVLYLIGPVNAELRAVPIITQMMVSWRRLREFKAAVPAGVDPQNGSSPVDERVTSIKAGGIRFSYKNSGEQHGFEVGPIHLEVKSGEILFIIGGNGSGKSTLAMLLTGLYEPDEGEIMINDKVVPSSLIGEYFSAVFNPLFLFDKLYNIDTEAKSAQLERYLAVLDLTEKVQVSGNRYSTIDLSGGQRKRLALLQCYLEDSPIYLFDEWAADQDPEYRNFFYRVLLPEMKKEGKIVIAITHDDHYFDVADRVVSMKLGKLEIHRINNNKNNMAQMGNIPEITAVKRRFEELREKQLVKEWEVPYEDILTRLSAAVFFFTPGEHAKMDDIWQELGEHDRLQYRPNKEKELSSLEWRLEFIEG